MIGRFLPGGEAADGCARAAFASAASASLLLVEFQNSEAQLSVKTVLQK